jgi:hypothetical protein
MHWTTKSVLCLIWFGPGDNWRNQVWPWILLAHFSEISFPRMLSWSLSGKNYYLLKLYIFLNMLEWGGLSAILLGWCSWFTCTEIRKVRRLILYIGLVRSNSELNWKLLLHCLSSLNGQPVEFPNRIKSKDRPGNFSLSSKVELVKMLK